MIQAVETGEERVIVTIYVTYQKGRKRLNNTNLSSWTGTETGISWRTFPLPAGSVIVASGRPPRLSAWLRAWLYNWGCDGHTVVVDGKEKLRGLDG